MTQHFFIGCKLPGMNEIVAAKGRKFWDKNSYQNLKLMYESMIKADIKKAKLKPVYGTVLVRLHWMEPNEKRDYDNIRAGVKFILDALVSKKILQDDSQKQVIGFTDSFGVDELAPGVKVTIEEVMP